MDENSRIAIRSLGQSSIIRRIPPEILEKIFYACLAQSWIVKCTPNEPPLLLCQVDSNWRQIAIASRRMWSSVSTSFTDNLYDNQVAFTRMWLTRAGNHPLSIHTYGPELSILYNPIRDIIIPYSNQIQVMTLYLSAGLFQPLFDLSDGSLNLLKEMRLEVLGKNEEDIWDSSALAFKEAPLLRIVHVHSSQAHYNPLMLRLPWAQLEEIVLNDHHSPWECLSALYYCINISVCRLALLSPPLDTQQFPDNPIILPHLRILEIETDQDLGPFLHHLTTPSLEFFEMRNNIDFIDFQPQEALVPMLERSSCMLQKLVIRGAFMEPEELFYCLQAVPMLVELVIDGGWFFDEWIIEQLMYRVGEAFLLPGLKVFKVLAEGPSFVDGDMVALIKSRWWSDSSSQASSHSPSRLKLVRIAVRDRRVDPEAIAQLVELRQEGLDVLFEEYHHDEDVMFGDD